MSTSKGRRGHEQTTPAIRVRLPTGMLARLDGQVDKENGENRSDVVRRLLALALKAVAR